MNIIGHAPKTSQRDRIGSFAGFLLRICLCAGVSFVVAKPAAALTLDEAMQLAASNTEAAALLEVSIASAEARERIAFGGLLPTASVTASATRNEQEVLLGGSTFVNQWDYGVDATVTLNLLRAGAIPNWAATQRTTEAEVLNSQWQSAGMRLAAGRAYFAALTARQNLDAANASLLLRIASSERATVLRETGYAVDADIARAQLSVVEAELAVMNADLQLAESLDTLAFVIGAGSVDADQLSDAGFTLLSDSQTTDERVDIEALDLSIRSAELTVRAERMTFLPSIRVSANYSLGRESLRAPDGTTWSIVFAADWLLFDWARYGRIDLTQTGVQQLELQRSQTLRAIDADIVRVERQNELAAERLILREQVVDLAGQTRSLTAELFVAGDVTSLEMTQADDEVFAAEIARNLAQLQRDVAALEVAYVRGQLVDRRDGE